MINSLFIETSPDYSTWTDHTNEIEPSSISVSRIKTSQPDTAQFSVVVESESDWRPSLQDHVYIYEATMDGVDTIDDHDLFGGRVVSIDETMVGSTARRITVMCKDYAYDLDRQLVADTFENQLVGDILQSILDTWTDGSFTLDNTANFTVKYIAFNYEYPSKCFQQLADLLSCEWYVDAGKQVRFFTKSTNPSPFNLSDSSGNYVFDTLKVNDDITSLKNSIIVRGGKYLGDLNNEKVVADGQAVIYKQGAQYNDVYVKVDGVSKTVGVDYLDDPTAFDCLYNFNERFVRFPTATKPAATKVVEVGGYPYLPVIVKLKNGTSIAQYGLHEFKVVDNSINSKEGARDRAKAEVKAWSETVLDAKFETREIALDVGDLITIQSTIRGINNTYLINRINTRLINGQELRHAVECISTRTLDMIDFFQSLLIKKDKEIVIDANEVVDLVEAADETIGIDEVFSASLVHNPIAETVGIDETFTPQALDYAVEFVAGPQLPSGTLRQFILDGSPLG